MLFVASALAAAAAATVLAVAVYAREDGPWMIEPQARRLQSSLSLQANQQQAGQNLMACGYHPYVAPNLTITGPDGDANITVDFASVEITAGNPNGTDAIRVSELDAKLCC